MDVRDYLIIASMFTAVAASALMGKLVVSQPATWQTWALLSLPVLVATVPLLGRKSRKGWVWRAVSAAFLWGWIMLLAFAGGIYYVPSAAIMTAAAAAQSNRRAPGP